MKENTTWLHIRAIITFVSLICLTLFIAMVAISKEPVVIDVSAAKYIFFGALFLFLIECIRFALRFYYNVRYKWLMILGGIFFAAWVVVTFIWAVL
ncbi:hypothetical protein ACFSY7_17155 [Kurthia populi]|mgnify:FL=1|uniref:Uncharacterized protein n=1 Tax=Kurthia populi TaxID=1562132 RepID=A0ABW5Y4E9_9BACL|nr:hypothetical protein [Candidatus Kurthia intestinigallinarum]